MKNISIDVNKKALAQMKHLKIGTAFSYIKNGANIKQDKTSGGIPVTRIETIYENAIDSSKLGYSGIKDDRFKKYYLEEGDILMSHINSVSHLGKVAIYEKRNEKIIHGMNLLCLKANKELLFPKYAYYYFKNPLFINDLPRITKKSVNQASFNISNLENIKIPTPEKLEDQIRIATILSKAEALIKQRKESIALLDEFLKSTFLEMFGDPVRNEKGWKKNKLKNICLKITDGTHFSPPIVENGVPYVTAKHVRENKIDFWSNPWFISEHHHKEIYKRCDPKQGDILYIKDGATTGYAAINKYEFEFSMLSSLALIRVNPEICNSEYLCSWLNSPMLKNRILKGMAGGAIQRLTLSKINELQVTIPPVALQNEFAQTVGKIEALKKQYQVSLEELEQLFSSLSQRAFKGELDLSQVEIKEGKETFDGGFVSEKEAEPIIKVLQNDYQRYLNSLPPIHSKDLEMIKKIRDLDFQKKQVGSIPFDEDYAKYRVLAPYFEEIETRPFNAVYHYMQEFKDITYQQVKDFVLKGLTDEKPFFEQVFDSKTKEIKHKLLL